jgi:polysaccharide export outer membrane protein
VYSGAVAGLGVCFLAFAPTIASAAANGPAGSVVDSSYRINAGDDLEIYVWGEDRLQREVRVLPDGSIAFPLAGQLSAKGKLPQELEQMLAERLRDQYRNQVPQITVTVKAPSGMQFSVLGKVRQPGSFSPGRYVNVLEALSLAGGPAEFANLDAILVIHKNGDKLSAERMRLSWLFKSGGNPADVDNAQIARVQVGDTIVVP